MRLAALIRGASGGTCLLRQRFVTVMKPPASLRPSTFSSGRAASCRDFLNRFVAWFAADTTRLATKVLQSAPSDPFGFALRAASDELVTHD
ncbi:hypothetical protein K458DRAFT_418329 [Lentithecium fluviatile CBS 122367]|uniref:Uncharacterized protein n=1 Tax=Lentithecium fluviatile CBS 122367 TaxID=1168545 RepID=A0A6G1J1I6_9PLEO|nr:hypothetical protein K458DRAFT_418329 [Lentithecium fluviatile CBS 122367]